MLKIKKINLAKKDIVKEISLQIGLPNLYIGKITDDLINILKKNIKFKKINIKNFGNFSVLNKSERIGRNPKNKKTYIITSRKSLSFSPSKTLIKKLINIK